MEKIVKFVKVSCQQASSFIKKKKQKNSLDFNFNEISLKHCEKKILF